MDSDDGVVQDEDNEDSDQMELEKFMEDNKQVCYELIKEEKSTKA